MNSFTVGQESWERASGSKADRRGRSVIWVSRGIGLLLLLIMGLPGSGDAATISFDGELRSASWAFIEKTGRTNEMNIKFHGLADESALKVTQPVLKEDANGQDCTSSVFVNREVVFNLIQCKDDPTTLASIHSADSAWQLGNCGSGSATCSFLIVRNSELFPESSGTRRLSSLMTSCGQPLGLITEAHYSYSNGPDGKVLVCSLKVSESLKKNWMNSPLLTAYYLGPEHLGHEKWVLAGYREGFVLETIKFSRFTNVGGIVLPTQVESARFRPSNTNASGRQIVEDRIFLTNIACTEPEPVTVLPIRGPVTISEWRLNDPRLYLQGASYQTTNDLASFEISADARAAFALEVNNARDRAGAYGTKRFITAVFAAVALGVPVVLFYMMKRLKAAR